CVFVFSGRRRHTSSYGDWSSDVCSSDLTALVERHRVSSREHAQGAERIEPPGQALESVTARGEPPPGEVFEALLQTGHVLVQTRSEERRVGKECRCRRSRENTQEYRRRL